MVLRSDGPKADGPKADGPMKVPMMNRRLHWMIAMGHDVDCAQRRYPDRTTTVSGILPSVHAGLLPDDDQVKMCVFVCTRVARRTTVRSHKRHRGSIQNKSPKLGKNLSRS